MGKFSWIGGGLGFLLGGGPIGAIIGAVIGSAIDQKQKLRNGYTQSSSQGGYRRQGATRGDFNMSFLVLVAAVMKADGKVLKSELNYVKENFVRMFGEEPAREAVRMLGDLIKQTIPLRDVCLQITRNVDHYSRLQLLHLLFGVAAADGYVHDTELQTIKRIATYFNISDSDFEAIKSMFVSDKQWTYKVLGIDKTASDEEVKKAYRKKAVKYHPDKVSHLGDEMVAQAKEKFQKVNDAYNLIKKERGLN